MKSLKTRDLILTRLPTISSLYFLFKSNEKTKMSSFVVVLCGKTARTAIPRSRDHIQNCP